MSWVKFGGATTAKVDFDTRIAKGAAALASLGVGRGDGIAIMLRNEPTFIEAGAAASSLGAYSVPINWHSLADELGYILTDSGAKALIIHPDLLQGVAGGIPGGVEILVADLPAAVSRSYPSDPSTFKRPARARSWQTFRDSFAPLSAEQAGLFQVIFYTSGTTGRPKGIKRILEPSQSEAIGAVMARSYGMLGNYGPAQETVTVVTGPMYHGLPNAHANFMYRAGANLIIMPRFDPEGLLRLIDEERVTHLNMVPIMFHRLLQLPRKTREKYDLSSLRYVAHGGAPMAPQVKREMIAWWGEVINEYYGATEVGNVAFCTSREWLDHPGTVGKPPPGTHIRIVDDQGNELAQGETGNIVCRIDGTGDMTYINHDDERRRIELVPGFITAGDLGYFDADGFLFISDRQKDMIISGGVNIYPAQIEAALHKMPQVLDCAVFGIPDEEFGEAIHAVVEPVAGSSIDAASVRNFLRDHIPSFMIPKTVDFAQGLPREDSGKLFKRKLRDPFWAQAGRQI